MSNFNTVYHKRSSVVTEGMPKQPTTDQIDYGEIAVNYADGYESLFIKNSSNEIIDFKSGEYVDNALDKHNDRITTLENYTVPDARANVLWIGTSIPAGDITFNNNGTTQSTTSDLGSNNYPKMVADALGFNLYNNARGASFVCFYPSSEDGTANWLHCQCVDVYKYTGIYNRNVAAGNDYQIFCPDNVHPHSDSTGRSNRIIAGVYINALRGICYN